MVHYLITLYPSTETEFDTNGLGSLGEAVSCKVTEEGNGSFELEMVYPVSGRRYKDLVSRSIILAKPNPVDRPQPFRIYEISRPINGLVTFYASHISYDLSGYPIKPFTAGSAVGAMAGLKTNSVKSHLFTFWTDKNVVSNFEVIKPIPTRSALGGIQGSILDIYGGEYKFDRFLVRLYTRRGYDRGVVIRYGKNLTDLKQEENCSKVYTGVLPYWYREEENEKTLIQLPELIVPTPGSYNFVNIYTLDLSSEFQENPTEDQLRDRTKKYIKDNNLGVPKVSLTVSFAQLEQTKEYEHLSLLERVELFDSVSVEFPEMNVSSKAKVCKTVYDVLSGRYSSVTLGEVRASISDTVINQGEQLAQEVDYAKSEIRKAVERATNWIVNGRGYMVAVKDEIGNWMEICSLDTPNIDTAINVWRWNNGGFGFSSHGYNGPYETAITQEGEIVADFITTGTLTASLIKAGVLQSLDGETFYLDLEAGILKMKATELSIEGRTSSELIETIDRKSTNFVTTPRPPYYVGDTWCDGTTSDIMTCIRSRETGKFVNSDWQKRNKYVDLNTTQEEAQRAVELQTQTDIFNKLTNGGLTQGIYIHNGLVYINGTYIKTGVITDGKGNNTWDLVSGTLIAKNITAYGSFRCGSSSATTYTILNTSGQLRGYKNSESVGYIDYSAEIWLIDDRRYAYGLQMQAEGIIRISSPRVGVAATSDTGVTTTSGMTAIVKQPIMHNFRVDGEYYYWTEGELQLEFINGLLVSYGVA